MSSTEGTVRRTASPALRVLVRFARRDWQAAAALAIVVLGCLIAVFCPLLASQNPYDLAQLNVADGLLPPGSTGVEGHYYLLGTDDQGRDILSGIFYGLRISLAVGILSALVAMTIGTAAGLFAAYWGGVPDLLLMRLVDLQLSVPAIFVALALVATLGAGLDKIIIALIVVQWAYYARTARSSALVERSKDYANAARGLRFGSFHVVVRELLPNCLSPLIVVGSAEVASAIRLEATLSFLGLGLPVTEPSLGLLIANGYHFMLSGSHWISIYPGLALLVIVASLNKLGDYLRDALDPQQRGAA